MGAVGGSPHRAILADLGPPSNKRTHVWRETTLAPLLSCWIQIEHSDSKIGCSTSGSWSSGCKYIHNLEEQRLDSTAIHCPPDGCPVDPRGGGRRVSSGAPKENATGERRTGRSGLLARPAIRPAEGRRRVRATQRTFRTSAMVQTKPECGAVAAEEEEKSTETGDKDTWALSPK